MKCSSLLLSAVGLLATCSLAQEASAQHVQFSFGGGGHHLHHCGPYGYGYGYGYRPYYDFYYAPPPRVTYVQPAPQTIILPQTAAIVPATAVAVAPATTTVASVPSTASIASTAPSLRSNSLPAYRGQGVTLQNGNAAGLGVACIVDGQSELSLRPGEIRPLKEKASYTVEFDRGGNYGSAKYQLDEGEYEFVVTDRGWDLQRATGGGIQTATIPEIKKNSLPVLR